MFRIWLFILCAVVSSCGDGGTKENDGGFGLAQFSEMFKKTALPFEISDTALLNNKDTTAVRNPVFDAFLPDSIKHLVFGKTGAVKYVPLVKAVMDDEETYFVLKAISGKKLAALIYVFDKEGSFGAAFPLLVPDSDPATVQVSSIDKAKTISRAITKQVSAEEIREGKDVYAYSASAKTFSLIMTDVLDDDKLELINPIDTLPKTNALAGDYRQGKKSLVSLRDGRNVNEIQFFIHFENEKSDCKGELKGTALFTSSKMAVYRQGGDPCVLELHFSSSAVTLREVEGCGSHRGLECSFNGKFTRRKATAAEAPTKK